MNSFSLDLIMPPMNYEMMDSFVAFLNCGQEGSPLISTTTTSPCEYVDLSGFENGDILESFLFDGPETAEPSSYTPILSGCSTNSNASIRSASFSLSEFEDFASDATFQYPPASYQSESEFELQEDTKPTATRKYSTSCINNKPNDVIKVRRRRRQGGPKEFRCSMCDNGHVFVRKQDLQRHEAIHSQVKEFVCPFDGCGFAFVRRDALTRHIKSRVCCK